MVEFPVKRLLLMMWILTGVLLLVNVAVSWRINNFEQDCVGNFDVEGECPCQSGKTQNIGAIPSFNATIYQGPVQPGMDEDIFRETGIQTPNNTTNSS